MEENFGREIEQEELEERRIWVRRDAQGRVEEAIRRGGMIWVRGAAGTGKTATTEMALVETGAANVRKYEMEGMDTGRKRKALEQAEKDEAETIWVEDLREEDPVERRTRLAKLLRARRAQRQGLIITSSELRPEEADEMEYITLGNLSPQEVREVVETAGLGREHAIQATIGSEGGNPKLVCAYIEEGRKQARRMSVLGTERMREIREREGRKAIGELEAGELRMLGQLAIGGTEFNESDAGKLAGGKSAATAAKMMQRIGGKWLEITGERRQRVSPLLSGLELKVLSEEERREAHEGWAANEVEKVRRGEQARIDTIIRNSIGSRKEKYLNLVSFWVVNAETEDAEKWRDATFLMRARIDKGTEGWMSWRGQVLLKLALLRVSLPGASEERKALVKETEGLITAGEERNEEGWGVTGLMAAWSITKSQGWQEAIDSIVAWAKIAIRASRNAEETEGKGVNGIDSEGNGMAQILVGAYLEENESAETLLHVVKDLNEAGEGVRKEILRPVIMKGSYAKGADLLEVLINAPWLAKDRKGNERPEDLLETYREMLKQMQGWSDERVRTYVRVAISIIENEYRQKPDDAREVLKDDAESPGCQAKLLIARAKVDEWEGAWERSAEKRAEARALGVEESNLSRMVTRRADAISAWRSGKIDLAGGLFREAYDAAERSRREMGSEETSRWGQQRRDEANALLLDSYIAKAIVDKREEAALGIYELAKTLKDEASQDSAVGNRTTRIIAAIAGWLSRKGEKRSDEIISEEHFFPGMASLPEWGEKAQGWEVGRKDYYLAAQYMCAIAEIRETGEERLARDLEEEDREIEGLEILLTLERLDNAIKAYDAEKMALRQKHIQKTMFEIKTKGTKGGSLTSRPRGKETQETGTRIEGERLEQTMIALTIQETLEGGKEREEQGESPWRKSLDCYNEMKGQSERLDWVEALGGSLPDKRTRKETNGWALHRTLSAMERSAKLSRSGGSEYETWRWGVQLWLYANANPHRRVIDAAMREWWERNGMEIERSASGRMKEGEFANALLKKVEENPAWRRDIDAQVRRQLEASAKKG